MGCLRNSLVHLINIYCPPTSSRLWASDVQLGVIPEPYKGQVVQKGWGRTQVPQRVFKILCLFYFVLFSEWVGCVEWGGSRWRGGVWVVVRVEWGRWSAVKTRCKSVVHTNVLFTWTQIKLENVLMIDWLWHVWALNINDIPYASPPSIYIF